MVATLTARAAPAVIELGAFRGVYAVGDGTEIEWIELPESDLVGRGRNLWIVPSKGGRTVEGAHGRGSRFWSAVFELLHGRPVTETRLIRAKQIPSSADYVGELMHIFYQPRRADQSFRTTRRHVFNAPRPDLFCTDGDLFVVGGSFSVTQFGIVG